MGRGLLPSEVDGVLGTFLPPAGSEEGTPSCPQPAPAFNHILLSYAGIKKVQAETKHIAPSSGLEGLPRKRKARCRKAFAI